MTHSICDALQRTTLQHSLQLRFGRNRRQAQQNGRNHSADDPMGCVSDHLQSPSTDNPNVVVSIRVPQDDAVVVTMMHGR